jgi:hypothetical protein
MDIKDVAFAKKVVEAEILKLINNLEEETSCSVSDIALLFNHSIGRRHPTIKEINIKLII